MLPALRYRGLGMSEPTSAFQSGAPTRTLRVVESLTLFLLHMPLLPRRHTKQVARYAGFDPSFVQFGEELRRGRISKNGNTWKDEQD